MFIASAHLSAHDWYPSYIDDGFLHHRPPTVHDSASLVRFDIPATSRANSEGHFSTDCHNNRGAMNCADKLVQNAILPGVEIEAFVHGDCMNRYRNATVSDLTRML